VNHFTEIAKLFHCQTRYGATICNVLFMKIFACELWPDSAVGFALRPPLAVMEARGTERDRSLLETTWPHRALWCGHVGSKAS
jgi:hypothetical protein